MSWLTVHDASSNEIINTPVNITRGPHRDSHDRVWSGWVDNTIMDSGMQAIENSLGWWCWHHTEGITVKMWQQWLMLGICPAESMTWTCAQARHFGVTAQVYHQWHHVVKNKWRDVQLWLDADPQHCLVGYDHAHYPPLLRHIHAPPGLLYVWGHSHVLAQRQCAVVGSRQPTGPALRSVAPIVASLVKHQVVITSGLALGIDGLAHQAALDHQGQTIAVLGAGMQHLYPKRHQDLAAAIATSGAVISAFALDTPVAPWQFPCRNRIISGMSPTTIVVEAAEKSGTMVTAQLALSQNREVLVLPSRYDNARARGGLRLIQEGAYMPASLEDIQRFVTGNGVAVSHPVHVMSADAHAVMICLGDGHATFEELRQTLHWPMAKLQRLLTFLKIQQWLIETPRGFTAAIALDQIAVAKST